MPGHYSKEELNQLDKQSLILLVTAMQDQLQQTNDSLNRLTEQIAAANQYRFGRHSKKMNDFDSQLSIFDLLNEAEHTVETASDLHEPDADEVVITYRRKKARGKREVDLKDLPVEKIDHVLPDEKLQRIAQIYQADNGLSDLSAEERVKTPNPHQTTCRGLFRMAERIPFPDSFKNQDRQQF